MPRLSGVRLSVPDPADLAGFYTRFLGMRATDTSQGLRVGYAGDDADIVLLHGGAPYRHDRSDRYWKIGITLPNVDIAHEQLSSAGVPVSQPHQFRDIGYMCHLRDPAGFQIELLQQDFEGNRPHGAGDGTAPLGGGARIGQITLRSGDIAATRAVFDSLGMRLLSVQPVPDLQFTLYFWAYTQEIPPHPELDATQNREWLWKRPYTTLEIQHLPGAHPIRNPGYQGLEIEGVSQGMDDDFGDHIRAAL